MATTFWLVEEHTTGYGHDETVQYHQVVGAPDAIVAFEIADDMARMTRTCGGEPAGFLFAASELEEVVPGFLWQAADGSSIYYEVRSLGTPTLDTVPAVVL